MSLREKLNLYLYQYFGHLIWVHQIVRNFYLFIFFPFLRIYLKGHHHNIHDIVIRHSINEKDNFNAFLSDMDIAIIIENQSSSKEIIQHFLRLKRICFFLDYPEVYSHSEFILHQEIKESNYWPFIYTLWSIRKINWNYNSLQNESSPLNQLKKNRSNNVSFKKILIRNISQEVFTLQDFRSLNIFGSNNKKTITFYSVFLETNKDRSIRLELSLDEFFPLLSLMPGEIQNPQSKLKKMITSYEILITKASMRIDEAQEASSFEKSTWLKKLEESLNG